MSTLSNVLTIFLLSASHDSTEIQVGTKNALCEECDGEGKVCRFRHDCFTLSDFDGDSEEMSSFADDIGQGQYDVPCPECKGKKVIKVADLSDLTAEQLTDYRRQQEEDSYHAAERASERRMGA